MKLTSEDKKRIRRFYRDNLNRHGTFSPEALGWSGGNSQLIRFQALLGVGDLNSKSILDAGCGLGDLYHFLRLNFDDFSYQGIDLVPEMIEKAKIKYPGVRFAVADILQYKDGPFDFVLSSGTFSFKLPRHQNKYYAMVRQLWGLCRIGLAFNMLNREGHVDDELYAAYDAAEVANFCRTLTPRVQLIQNYSPQDFTLYLYR